MFEFEEEIYFDPSEDGYTHLNAYSKGRTRLGRMLSNFAYSPFVFEPYGHFKSMEGFWYWYCTGQKHDILRTLSGAKAKAEGQKFPRVITSMSDEDISTIQDAMVAKIVQNSEIKDALMKCNLEIVHYYVYAGRVVRLDQKDDWFAETLNMIRDALQGK
ncbi:hypothetical protein EJP02_341 [Escherichia phage EJP2]|nr:hypothetical protein EJP02_341 [Escherichia phage EJP2]